MPAEKPARRSNVTVPAILLFVGMMIFLAYVIWAFQASWKLSPGIHLSGHGWAALVLAFVLTGAIGGGLMWLMFYSARKGYDDGVGGTEDQD